MSCRIFPASGLFSSVNRIRSVLKGCWVFRFRLRPLIAGNQPLNSMFRQFMQFLSPGLPGHGYIER